MAQPTSYIRVTSFTNYQAVNPTAPLPGSSVDQEFNRIKTTLDEILVNIELIQRDDGDLANDSVGRDQLSSEVDVGFNAPVVWQTSTAYAESVDTVFHGSAFYRCIEPHTSGTFATDLSAEKWELIVDLATIPLVDADQIAVTAAGTISSTNVQDALEELDTEKAALFHTHAASAISDSTSAGRALLTAASASAQRTALGLAYAVPNYGEIREYAGITAPSGWLFCYGQAISRTDYADLFAAITISQTAARVSGSPVVTVSATTNMRVGMPVSGTGIATNSTIVSVDSGTQLTLSLNATSSGSNTLVVAPHGVGDSSTTFNVPDRRGRVAVGRDDMGGTSANRLTDQSGGLNGDRLGDDGGSEQTTILQANLPNVTFNQTLTIPAGNGITTQDAEGYSTVTIQQGSGVSTTVMVLGNVSGPKFWVKSAQNVSVQAASGGSGTAINNVQPSIVENFIIFAGV